MFGIFRFVLALNVVLFHILAIPEVGPLAVYSFFILSGYLMTYIMQETYGYSYAGIRKYALNRFFRLYPVYWALLLVSVILVLFTDANYFALFHNKMTLPSNPTEVMANVLMIYPELRPGDYSVRLAPATWALTIELFFYLLIGIGISKSKTQKRTIIWLSLSIAYLLYDNFFLKNFGFNYGGYFSASLPFALGAFLYFYRKTISKWLENRTHFSLFNCTVIFVLNLALCSTISYLDVDYGWKVKIICTGMNMILSALMIMKLSQIKSNNKSLKVVDKFTGDLSYPVYVFHWAGACFASWIIYPAPEKNIITFLLGIVITVSFSLVVNVIINDKVELIRLKVKKQNKVLQQQG